MRSFFSTVVFLGLASAYAQTNSDPNIWYGFFNKTELNQSFSWWTETQLRYNLDTEGMGQTLVRTGLLVPVKNSSLKSEFGLLYAYIHTGLSKEHRLALQHSMIYSGGWFSGFSHRMRYEFRTLEQGSALSNRFRYLIRYNGPNISENSKLIAWDELFLNMEKGLNDDINHLDRNRFFIGLRIPFNNLSMEVGYLNQWAPRNSTTQVDHIVVAYLFF